MAAVQKHKAPLYGCHHGFLFLLFFSCPQSMCEVLSPGLAVSVLKAIFQEVHVQVSNVISHYPVPAPWVSGNGLPALRTEHISVTVQRSASFPQQCSPPAELRDSVSHCRARGRQQLRILFGPCPLFSQPWGGYFLCSVLQAVFKCPQHPNSPV